MEHALRRSYAMLSVFVLACFALGLMTLAIAIEYRRFPVENAYPFFGLGLSVLAGLVALRWESIKEIPPIRIILFIGSIVLTILLWWTTGTYDMSKEKKRALYAGRYWAIMLVAGALVLSFLHLEEGALWIIIATTAIGASLYLHETFVFITED